MRRRGFTPRRRGGRSRLPLRWTGDFDLALNTTAAAATFERAIVLPTDYEQSATLEPGGVTLVRIRGTVSAYAVLTGTLLHQAIVVVHDDVAAGATVPNVYADWIQGNVLWQALDILPNEANIPRTWEIDIKSKRRLERDRVIYVAVSTTNAWSHVESFRALIKGG